MGILRASLRGVGKAAKEERDCPVCSPPQPSPGQEVDQSCQRGRGWELGLSTHRKHGDSRSHFQPHQLGRPREDSEAGALVAQPPQVCEALTPAIHLPAGTLGQSPGPRPTTPSTAAATAAAAASTAGAAAAAPVLIDGDLDNPHPTLHRVCKQEASRRKDLLILLLDVAGDLLEDLLIVGLHAEEDEVGSGTRQAALEVGTAPNLLCFCVKAVESLHSLLKELSLNPAVQLWREFGLELTNGPIAVVSLDKDLGGQ